MKVGGCDEAKGQRRHGTRGVWRHAPPGIFLKFGVSVMHFPDFRREIMTLRALLSMPFLPSHYKDILKNVQNV